MFDASLSMLLLLISYTLHTSVGSAGCLDGSGDYLMTVPDIEPSAGYKIRYEHADYRKGHTILRAPQIHLLRVPCGVSEVDGETLANRIDVFC